MYMPRDLSIKKTLVIGSGPIVIGQAAEFDYAGAQACRVLKSEGVNVVLCNSNPATIMTDKTMADEIYLEPLDSATVKRIIEKEKPDSLLAGLGGQTGLTIASELYREGFLESHHVRLIGSDAEAIDKAEDRQLFKETMARIGEPTVPSEIATTVDQAVKEAEKIGYPVIIRPAFTLGGSGGGVAYNSEEMALAAETGLDASPIHQILVEKYIFGWKEIEFETMRDSIGNVIAVCSMENVDPVGIHTGDSVVVAPALTLSDKEFQMLRSASLHIISELGIVGGCNCQFALDPVSFEYAVIEVNPRVSRSSALASKATGYPIAKITAKIALGYTLEEIPNDITKKTCACFEPTLDYVVVKFPKWPFDKFAGCDRSLGTQMKATGEVMAIAPTFEMALMKAVRGAEISLDTLNFSSNDKRSFEQRLKKTDDHRLFTIFEALKNGVSIEKLYELTRVDRWFLSKLQNLAAYENRISGKVLSKTEYLEGKNFGYTDKALLRISTKPLPAEKHFVYRMVDTCAAEFDAETPYFYSTCDGICEASDFPRSGKPVVMVLGSGPIRIGQGIEFDYSSVHCVRTLKEMGYDAVIVNNNPETVSTDYDTADRLYFEPLCPEDVMNIIRVEKPVGVVVAFGGQTAIKLTSYLDRQGVRILGTSAEGIDIAEDREKFDKLLERFSIRRPSGRGVKTMEEAVNAAKDLGLPVLLRPSYVIGGQNMRIAHTEEEVVRYMEKILSGGIENPVLVDKYMMGTELEVDVISDGESVLIPGVMEHIERAGVHSGDSIAVYPPYNLNDRMMKKVVESSEKLALALGTKGLVNIQYLIYGGELYVIEVNPRASRTIPYISKVTGVPMVGLASRVMVGEKLADLGYGVGLYKTPPYFAVKVPVFSFEKLMDVNSYLGPEMKSTGEVLGIGKTLEEALFKGLRSAGFKTEKPDGRKVQGALVSVDSHDQREIVGLCKQIDDLGYALYATTETAESIRSLGIDAMTVGDIGNESFRLMEEGKIAFIVYTGALADETLNDYIALHRKAVQLSIPCFTSLDTAAAFCRTVRAGYTENNTELVDLNAMRQKKELLSFTKMQATGDDYIFFENFDGKITCPESLCISLCDRNRGIGGYGMVLLEKSEIADIRMRIFNRDGSEGKMAGNCIRCVGKYVYDKGIVKSDCLTVETASGVKKLTLYTSDGLVTYVDVDMGEVDFDPRHLPTTLKGSEIVNQPLKVGEKIYEITCLSVGNPHAVTFLERVDPLNLQEIGPLFENHSAFPERINTEFVRVVNECTLKMRVYERGNGETPACGTGACAAVAAAVKNGFCREDTDVTVKVRGGDLVVRCSEGKVTLSGDAVKIYEGTVEI